ncbi:MAG: NAD(P)H-quinone oxidoreductase [Microscillaceae bacterium]|jgi:putative PIG3 family NAD(P)H quinone oxidoreductase|nr:NAD(P)H-quinone oxidoreductase [Microscillaceae bacterium]
MKAVTIKQFGGVENLVIDDWQTPEPQAQEVLVKVHATALNRADLMQREGKYPPPPGASPILGLEIAGEIVAVGDEVKNRKIGDRVCGLIPGGGYAQYAVIDEQMTFQIPQNLSFEAAAGIPEVFLTAYQALRWLAKIQPQEKVLIHAGASGVGTAAIQLAKIWGNPSYVTASSAKHALCLDLGATQAIDYKTQDFAQSIMQLTDNQGVDVIIDFMASSYLAANLQCLKVEGRMVMLALMGGAIANNINLALVLMKRLQIIGSTLRARPLAYQISLTQEFWSFAENHFKQGTLKPIIAEVLDWQAVQQAHQLMEANSNAGKIILKISD